MNFPLVRRLLPVVLLVAVTLLSGCASAYYKTAEKFGYAKRDILVSRVEDARDAQTKAKEQFQDTLTQFLTIAEVEPGEIKGLYDNLNSELKTCEARAKTVRSRIESIEEVSEALFREWTVEAALINDPADRRESERLLRETRARADGLVRTMHAAADRMDPILVKFRDKVLLLKANLNAQAVAGLSGTARSLEADVSRLVANMEKSIREAETFLAGMRG